MLDGMEEFGSGLGCCLDVGWAWVCGFADAGSFRPAVALFFRVLGGGKGGRDGLQEGMGGSIRYRVVVGGSVCCHP